MRAAGEWQRMLESAPAEQWPGLLEEHSGLPGPRANLELLAAAARLGAGARGVPRARHR